MTVQKRTPDSETLSFDGSKPSFELLFKKLYAPLVRYALMHVRDEDEAEDVVQQLFVKLWQQRASHQAQQIKSYLYRSVYHECVNRARHNQVKGHYMEQNLKQLNEAATRADEASEEKELSKRISTALESLPEQCGKAFKLSRFHHLSYAEIAQVMGISVKTVENHMGKALSLLRIKLADYLVTIIIFTFIYH